jgi:hypothetical protein
MATDVAAGIVAAASALYGFVMAYYIFARSLSRQEERWVREDSRTNPPWIAPEELDRRWLFPIGFRRLALNLLLIATTVSFVPSVLGGLWASFDPGPWPLGFATGGFLTLLGTIVLYLLGVARLNMADTIRDIRLPPNSATIRGMWAGLKRR